MRKVAEERGSSSAWGVPLPPRPEEDGVSTTSADRAPRAGGEAPAPQVQEVRAGRRQVPPLPPQAPTSMPGPSQAHSLKQGPALRVLEAVRLILTVVLGVFLVLTATAAMRSYQKYSSLPETYSDGYGMVAVCNYNLKFQTEVDGLVAYAMIDGKYVSDNDKTIPYEVAPEEGFTPDFLTSDLEEGGEHCAALSGYTYRLDSNGNEDFDDTYMTKVVSFCNGELATDADAFETSCLYSPEDREGWQEGYDNAESPTSVSSVPESLIPEDVLQARREFRLKPEHKRNVRDMSRGACVLLVALVLTTGALSYAIYRKKSKSVK